MIVVDSDVLIEIIDKKSKEGDEAFRRIAESKDAFSITSITLHEVLYGAIKYKRHIEELLQLPVLDYTKSDAILSAELELKAELKGRKMFRADSMIAAIAINNGARLFTQNKKHFNNVDGLELF